MQHPPLPKLSEEYHNNIFRASSASSSVPNFEHLTFIGGSVVQLSIMHHLHDHFPTNPLTFLQNKLGKNMNNKPTAWGRLYKLRSLCSRGGHDPDPPSSPSRSHGDLFLAYVGALFLDNGGCEKGFPETHRWVKSILEYEMEDGGAESDEEDKETVETLLSEPHYTSPSSTPTRPLSNRNATAAGENGGNHATSLLNELAMKQKRELFWDDSSSGLPHLSIWTVKLKVSGSEKEYTGTGSSKKAARALAAESALKDLQ